MKKILLTLAALIMLDAHSFAQTNTNRQNDTTRKNRREKMKNKRDTSSTNRKDQNHNRDYNKSDSTTMPR